MARPVWTGSISFGMVSIPVKLATATEDHDISFHQFERGTGERVRNQRVAEESGEEVALDDIVKGYEARPGEHVLVERDELDAVAPDRSRSIAIEDFVDLGEVDPIYFRRSYHVVPADRDAARPYALLTRALADAGRTGIARFVMRGKEHLAAIRSSGGYLVLETMFFADEIRDPSQVEGADEAVAEVELGERELATAAQLVESMAAAWDPERYEDTHRQEVLALIERKAEGEEVVTESPEAEAPPVIDLMEALEASVAAARGRGSSDPGGTAAGDLGELSRDELYDRAQDAGVEGRSKMSKDELVAALRDVESGTQAAAS